MLWLQSKSGVNVVHEILSGSVANDSDYDICYDSLAMIADP